MVCYKQNNSQVLTTEAANEGIPGNNSFICHLTNFTGFGTTKHFLLEHLYFPGTI